MLKFFRRIRKQLLASGNFRSYSLYAIGEILLIVIGILIALQINNWNEEQKKTKLKHEKYSAILLDLQRDFSRQEVMKFSAEGGGTNTNIFTNELNPDNFSKEHEMVDRLMYVLDYYSYVEKNHAHLTGEITDKKVSNQLARYLYFQHGVSKVIAAQNAIAKDLRTYLGNNGYLNMQSDGYFFNPELRVVNPAKFEDLIRDEAYQGFIVQYRMIVVRMRNRMSGLMNANQQLQVTLAEHIGQPLYDDLEILGSALPHGGNRSIPMKRTNKSNNSWEISLDLEKGEVKFQVDNKGRINFGGNRFPEGELHFDGSNIPVKKGRYLIQVDLADFSYSFKKVD